MALLGLRWFAAAAFVSAGAMGAVSACGGDKFTLIADDGGGAGDSGAIDAEGPDANRVDGGPGTPSFCAMEKTTHLLCDDFDLGTSDMPSDDKLWMGFAPSPTGDGRIDKVQSFSPPRSLSVFQIAANPVEAFALLSQSLGHAKTVSLSFEVMIEAYGSGGMVTGATALTSISFGPVQYSLIAQSPTQLFLSETLAPDGGATPTVMTTPAPAALGTGTWSKVQLTLNLPQTGSQGSFSIVVGTTASGGVLTYPTGPSPSGTILLGFYTKGSPGIWRIRYDNVVVDKIN